MSKRDSNKRFKKVSVIEQDKENRDWKNEAKAQRDGDIYAHGSAFTSTLDINNIPTEPTIPVLQQMPCTKKAISKTSLQGYAGFAIDSTTGFPINPGTGRIIDGSELYCKFWT